MSLRLGFAAGLLAAAAALPPAQAAGAAAEAWPIESCCTLCPQAADPRSYAFNKGAADYARLLEGSDRWLFRSGFDLSTDFGLSDAGYAELRRLSEALRRHGTELVLVYQPARALVESRYLADQDRNSYDAALARRNYVHALHQFRELGGVVVPQLERLLEPQDGSDYFFRRDHHWTPAGAERTAQVVAEAIKAMPAFAGIPQKSFETRRAGLLAKPGTLQKFATQMCGFGYPVQYVPRYDTQAAGGADLLGDSAAPQIALAGTSNSDSKGGYNFAGYLQQYLGAELLNVSVSGGGVIGSMLLYLGSEEFRQHPPKILVWEVPHWEYKPDYLKIYRQAVPMVSNGCQGKPAVLSNTVELHRGLNEVLFNGRGGILPISGRGYVADLRFSDPQVKDLDAMAWYFNGRKDTLKLHFSPYVDTQGRFVLELRHDMPAFADGTLMALNLPLDQEPARPLKLQATICKGEADAPPDAGDLPIEADALNEPEEPDDEER